MDGQMTVGEFKRRFGEFAREKAQDVLSFVDFLNHRGDKDKDCREEWVPIMAYLKHFHIPDSAEFVLGGKVKGWDACIGGDLFIEVTMALPENAHEIRRAIAGNGLTLGIRVAHANDHLQIPDVAIRRIAEKNAKDYPPNTVLLVAVQGEDSFEDDGLIGEWITRIRRRADRGRFAKVFLVETARYKLFPVF